MAAAAEYFKIKPDDPRLLHLLADVVFGHGKKGRPRGTKTSWGSRLLTLGRIYDEKKNKNPKLSGAEIARLIKSEHDEFKNDDDGQIRQRLRAAHKEYHFWCLDQAADYAAEPPEGWEPPEPDDDDGRD